MSADFEDERLEGARLLLGVTGSIAAYKSVELVRLFRKAGAEVQVLMSPNAERFIPSLTLGTLSGREVLSEIFPEEAPENGWTEHVTLGGWGDLFVVAPASASTIAALARGDCDSMLTAVALSARCPMLVCPAMDRDMYRHPATQANLDRLREYGYLVMEPESGDLASGLRGVGRLPEPLEIALRTADLIAESDGDSARVGESGSARVGPRSVLEGRRVLVTAGPTREPIDPVRFVSNPSTGTTGFALAAEAVRRGADVTLVSGPSTLDTPAGVRRVNVQTAEEMRQAVLERADADVVLMSAAVADYRPRSPSDRKIKKDGESLTLEFERTGDILRELGEMDRPGQVRVGFALETHDGLENARRKLEEKHLDWIVLNAPNEPGAGFGGDTNRVTLLGREGAEVNLPVLDKRRVAEEILDRVEPLVD